MKQWWRRRTLRFRLAAWYAIGGTILLTAFSATVYWYVDYTMGRPLDHELQLDLGVIRKRLQVTEDGRILWDNHDFRAGEPWPAANPWFELWDENGKLLRRYWPFVDSRLEQLPLAPAPHRETISVFRVSPDVRLRVLSVPLGLPGAGEGWMIRVMSIHEPAVTALHSLILIIAVALPVVVLLLVFGGYGLTRRWLKPLDSMVGEAGRITASDLSRRLPIENPEDELGKLATVFNSTLSRLDDSFATLDRFVADASHELLTPLTTLRSVGEVGLRGAREGAEYREIIASMLEEAQRLQLLVEKLLQLARAEGGSNMLERKAVRLDSLAEECVEDARILAEEKRQQILLKTEPCSAFTDELLYRQALQNVLENAIKYSPPESTIIVVVSATREECSVCVTDDGPGISPAHQTRLMERFYRADHARGRREGGFGLGLAITKAYMHVLGGKITYESGVPRGSVFRLSVPRMN
ncbi:MAG TPA: ATP-binding protein [Opitutaceae bacterium]|nr:ATP-binding protein [Opitutaceae bacterium]